MHPLERFHDIARLPLSQWRDRFPNHRPLGIYNAYVPEEIFDAAGLTPIYLFHRSENRGQARIHLPSFACWPGRSLVDQALSGELDGLDGIAFAQTCDVVQALTDVCRKAVPDLPLYHVGMPANLTAPAARRYLSAELNRLCQALGAPSEEALRQACSVHHRTRELIGHLYDRAGDLPPNDLYAALRAAFLMPRQAYNESLAELLEGLPETPFHGPRLILVGPHLADAVLYQVVQDAGARIVDDLLDLGHRHFAGPGKSNGDPIANLVERLLQAPPTPTKHHPAHRRDHYLVALADHKQADGIIFARQKFCDPHGFDYATLGAALDEAGVPHLLVELEQSAQLGQLRTRVQAFLETIALHSPSRPESVQ